MFKHLILKKLTIGASVLIFSLEGAEDLHTFLHLVMGCFFVNFVNRRTKENVN